MQRDTAERNGAMGSGGQGWRVNIWLCAAWALACAWVFLPAGPAAAEEVPTQKSPMALLESLGEQPGIAVVWADRLTADQVEALFAHLERSRARVFLQLADPRQTAELATEAYKRGMYNRRLFLEYSLRERLAVADNLADAVVLLRRVEEPVRAEALRAVRPEGAVAFQERVIRKPVPKGAGAWSHHYHSPDNNTQSEDTLARAPFLTQFVVEPRYAPAPQSAVAAGGRIFMALGHVAWHEREEPWLNTLVALNGYNGSMLWKRPLVPGIMVDRSLMVATPSVLYLADNRSCKVLDAASGEMRDEITVPRELTEGNFWKWIALHRGVLFALVGEDGPLDEVARWRRTQHGWPWEGISQLYNADKYTWGFSKTLLAIDPVSKQVLWSIQEAPPIDSRSMCMVGDRMFYGSFGEYLVCRSVVDGRELWRRTPEDDPELFEAIGPYRPGHGYIGGWKSTVYMRCTEEAVYIVGPQVHRLTVLSAEDGHLLWQLPAQDLQILIRDDGLYTLGPQNSNNDLTLKLDPLSGEVLAKIPVRRRACTRITGSCDSVFFRAFEGTGRLVPGEAGVRWMSPMRPSCNVGVVPANGHVYWVPWVCDCDLQTFGAIGLAPAGDFDFNQSADAERLEVFADGPPAESHEVTEGDWPTHRADNQRTATTPQRVPQKVRRGWTFRPQTAAEPTSPVCMGDQLFLADRDGVVRCLSADSGELVWRAFVGGPVFFAPTVACGRVYVGGGDGYLWCLAAESGRPVWRFRAAPADRRIAVYDKLQSTWPAAASTLVEDGVVFCAAGMHDFDGTHVYALDAQTGEIVWQNNTVGHLDPVSQRGIACQGEMLLHGDVLCLAGGNYTTPGVFSVGTGECFNEPLPTPGSAAPRGRELTRFEDRVEVSGQPLYSPPEAPVYDQSTQWKPDVVHAADGTLRTVRTERGWGLAARDQNGELLWVQPLPSEPVRWSTAVDRSGRIVVALRSGTVLAFEARE